MGLVLRLDIAARDLSSPHKDENEIVEQAAAFLGGDLRFHFLKYGPLTMYIVAGLYRLVALLRGQSALEYASYVFFEGVQHYYIARAVCAVSLSIAGLGAALVLLRQSGPIAGVAAAISLGLPGVEILTTGFTRTDTMQAAFQTGCLLALMIASSSNSRRSWLAAGLCAGCAIAAKPLPALLVLPCLPVASWFASKHAAQPAEAALPLRLRRSAFGPWLWLSLPAAAAAAVLGNPAMLNVRHFLKQQIETVTLHSSEQVSWVRQDVSEVVLGLGTPFLVLAALGWAVALFSRKPTRVLPALFLALYLAAFWGRAARNYYMIAPAMAAGLLLAEGAAALDGALRRYFSTPLERRARLRWLQRSIAPGLIVLALWAPFSRLVEGRRGLGTVTQARNWITENIPPETKIFHVGWWPNGPRLVAMNRELQATWGDYFDYGRNRYPFLKEAFALGYERYARSGGRRYDIAVYDGRPEPRKRRRSPRWLTDSLAKRARKAGQQYIVLAGFRGADVLGLGYPWFKEATLKKQVGAIAIFALEGPPG